MIFINSKLQLKRIWTNSHKRLAKFNAVRSCCRVCFIHREYLIVCLSEIISGNKTKSE
jgi:hypothetical protein